LLFYRYGERRGEKKGQEKKRRLTDLQSIFSIAGRKKEGKGSLGGREGRPAPAGVSLPEERVKRRSGDPLSQSTPFSRCLDTTY